MSLAWDWSCIFPLMHYARRVISSYRDQCIVGAALFVSACALLIDLTQKPAIVMPMIQRGADAVPRASMVLCRWASPRHACLNTIVQGAFNMTRVYWAKRLAVLCLAELASTFPLGTLIPSTVLDAEGVIPFNLPCFVARVGINGTAQFSWDPMVGGDVGPSQPVEIDNPWGDHRSTTVPHRAMLIVHPDPFTPIVQEGNIYESEDVWRKRQGNHSPHSKPRAIKPLSSTEDQNWYLAVASSA